MNLFVTNPGFHHIAVQIFDDLTPHDLLQCRAVSADWHGFIDSTFWVTWWKYLKKKSKRYQWSPFEGESLDCAFRYYQKQMKTFYNIALKGNLAFYRELASELILYNMNLSVTRPVNAKFPHWKSKIEELSKSQNYVPPDFFEEQTLRKQLISEYESLHHLPLVERFPDWKEAIFDFYEAENNMEHLKLLIKLINGYYNDKNVWYETNPLHYATKMGHLDLLELIKNRPIEFDVKDKNGMTPLLIACETGQLEIVKFFLKNCELLKIDVNARDNDGNEMFSHAVLSFNRKVIEELMELYREVRPGVEPLDIDWERLNQIELFLFTPSF